MHTTTSTYTVVTFADPYKVCTTCGGWVTGAREWPPGTEHGPENEPCGHPGYESVCPSWSPVRGCQCAEFLGRVVHAEPPSADPRRSVAVNAVGHAMFGGGAFRVAVTAEQQAEAERIADRVLADLAEFDRRATL